MRLRNGPITVQTDQHGRPVRFTWSATQYQVHRIQMTWGVAGVRRYRVAATADTGPGILQLRSDSRGWAMERAWT